MSKKNKNRRTDWWRSADAQEDEYDQESGDIKHQPYSKRREKDKIRREIAEELYESEK